MAELTNLLQLLVSLYHVTAIKLLTKSLSLAELLSDSHLQKKEKEKKINICETDLKKKKLNLFGLFFSSATCGEFCDLKSY